MKYIILFCVFGLLCCTKQQEEICHTTFKFNIPLNINPQLDTFKVGDTIWLSSNISNNLEDLNSLETIDVENFDFKVRIAITRFDINDFNVAEHFFEFINQAGELNQTSAVNTNVIYENNENSKMLLIGLVPIEVGGFYFSFYNLRQDLQRVSLIDTNCIQLVELDYNMNDGNNNLDFIKENPNPANETSIESLQKDGTYAFWIVE